MIITLSLLKVRPFARVPILLKMSSSYSMIPFYIAKTRLGTKEQWQHLLCKLLSMLSGYSRKNHMAKGVFTIRQLVLFLTSILFFVFIHEGNAIAKPIAMQNILVALHELLIFPRRLHGFIHPLYLVLDGFHNGVICC